MSRATSADLLPPPVSGALPLVGHALEFLLEPVRLLERGYREHGHLFSLRLGNKKAVVVLGPEHHRFFFGETDKRLSLRAAYPFFSKMFDEGFFFLGNVDDYLRQRALVIPRFQGRELARHVGVMVRRTRGLMTVLGASGEFDLTEVLGPLVLGIAGEAFLGEHFSHQVGGELFAEFRCFSQGMEPVLPLWLPLPHLLRSRQAKARLHRLVGDLIRERRARPLEPPDFFQMLVEASYDNGETVPEPILIHLVLLLIWAGHETTTGHISWALIELLRHPEYLDAVLHEQAEAITAEDSFDQFGRLERMEWALRETERLHPVAYVLMRAASEPFLYSGFEIPEGCLIFVAPCVAHRLPEVFSDPDRYDPERFASHRGPDHRYDLIGFGGGVHRCLGMNFAYLEMKVVLTLLLQRYDFELIDRDPDPVRGPKTKWPQSPCRVSYRRRVA